MSETSNYQYNTEKAMRYTNMCIEIAQERWGDVILQATPQVWADGTVSVGVANRPQDKDIISRCIRFHEDTEGKNMPHLSVEVTPSEGISNRYRLEMPDGYSV